jgi:hypothetical protein
MMIGYDIYDRFTMAHFPKYDFDDQFFFARDSIRSIHFVLNFSRSNNLNFGTVIMFCK